MKRKIVKTTAFERSAKKFLKQHSQLAGELAETLKLLAEDAGDPRLRVHKLKGKLADFWSASAGYDLRMIFSFGLHEHVESIYLLAIGTHDDVY